jgi:hypothetical protein
MKQKDIALIAVLAILSGIISLIVSNLLFSSPKTRQQTVQVVSPITADFKTPDSTYFNAQSIDPTQLIQIGNGGNPNPFTTKQQ